MNTNRNTTRKKKNYETVFDAREFGYPDGIDVKDFLEVLKKTNQD